MTEKKQTYLERVTDETLDLFYPTMKKTAKETVQSVKEHPIKTAINLTNPIGRTLLANNVNSSFKKNYEETKNTLKNASLRFE